MISHAYRQLAHHLLQGSSTDDRGGDAAGEAPTDPGHDRVRVGSPAAAVAERDRRRARSAPPQRSRQPRPGAVRGGAREALGALPGRRMAVLGKPARPARTGLVNGVRRLTTRPLDW